MKRALTLLLLALAACGSKSDDRVCLHTGGMEAQACTYDMEELGAVRGAQGVHLYGWLVEEKSQLYLTDDKIRIPIRSVEDRRFAEVRTRMVGRYVSARGLYDGAAKSLTLYHIRWVDTSDGTPLPLRPEQQP